MENPKISIIVPVYKVEKYLAECLESILSQTFTEFECILVNDNSPDKSPDICNEYAKKDKRIKVIHKKENEGLPQARKTGISEATGEYIMFIDSDDWVEPKMAERLYSLAKSENYDIVYCDAEEYFDPQENGKPYIRMRLDTRKMSKDDIMINLIKHRFDCSLCTRIFKRELFENIIFPTLQQWEDAVVCVQLFLKATKIGYEYSILYHHRINPHSLTFKNDMENIKRRKYETFTNWMKIKNILSQRDDYYKYKEAIEWRMKNLHYQETPSIMKSLMKLLKYMIPYGIIELYRSLKRKITK